MTSLSRILCLSGTPSLHHQDLEYAMVAIDLETDGRVVSCGDKPLHTIEGYVDTREEGKEGKEGEKGIAFLRIMRSPVYEKYFACMCYSPSAVYTPDPFHRLVFTAEEGSTLTEVLQKTYRLFPYYTQDKIYPLPYQGTWIDIQLTPEAVEGVEQEALSQGIGARRA